MSKKKFNILIVVTITVLGICAVGMICNADRAHFIDTMKILIEK